MVSTTRMVAVRSYVSIVMMTRLNVPARLENWIQMANPVLVGIITQILMTLIAPDEPVLAAMTKNMCPQRSFLLLSLH